MNDELKIQNSEFGIQNEEVSSLRAERSNLETNKIILQVLLAKFGLGWKDCHDQKVSQ